MKTQMSKFITKIKIVSFQNSIFRNYNKNLRILMKSMKDFGKTSAMVASHNEDSVRFALQL